MANQKLKLLYLVKFLQEETDEEHPRTVQEMIAYLSSYDISAERKSIYDDLKLLEFYGLDIQSVKAKSFGYFLGERSFQLAELKMLIDVVQASPFLTQSKSMELIGKLADQTSRSNARELRRQVYVMHRVKTSNEALYYAVDGIHAAINENKKISFRYFDWTVKGEKAFRREGKPYVVNPVALCVDRFYYLIAYDALQKEYRHYRVDRMARLEMLPEDRDALPQDFDLGSYVKTIFDMFNGETVSVHLRFHRELINVVMDRFGADAHLRADGPAYFELFAPVEVGPTFFGWLFQFGGEAQIMGPEEVRRSYLAHCQAAAAAYLE